MVDTQRRSNARKQTKQDPAQERNALQDADVQETETNHSKPHTMEPLSVNPCPIQQELLYFSLASCQFKTLLLNNKDQCLF